MSFRESFLDIFYPKHCVACDTRGTFFCEECFDGVKYLKEQVCPHCQKPSVDGITHFVCRGKHRLDALYSAIAYQGVVQPLIRSYKYKPYIVSLEPQITLILKRVFTFEEDYYPSETLVTAVPLHWYRQQVRGFNQAEKLARVLAEIHGFETDFDLLRRVDIFSGLLKKPQTRLSKIERQQSVRGSFDLKKGSQARIKNRAVLVADDLWTTGATLKECGQVLKRAGASQVFAATLARG